MSWLKSSIAQYAQDALVQAQASIDKALEIEPEQDPLAGLLIVLEAVCQIYFHLSLNVTKYCFKHCFTELNCFNFQCVTP